MGKRKTTEDFILDARKVHGDRYDYSKVEYVNNYTKVCIICKDCNKSFYQSPSSHLSGKGCPNCKGGININKEEFINRARLAHGDKYDYSESVYINSLNKIKIKCPIHGYFYQLPSNHILGQGCPYCVRINTRKPLFGVGINDMENTISSDKTLNIAHNFWRNMLQRCYSKPSLEKHPSYKSCKVDEEWKYFSNFYKWFKDNYIEDWCLDKDLLSDKNNKIYSENTCCFLPQEINKFLIHAESRRGDLPLGVSKWNGKHKYRVSINIYGKQKTIGYFDDIETAFLSYKESKEQYAKYLANKWKGKIADNVYKAMMSYKVEITD